MEYLNRPRQIEILKDIIYLLETVHNINGICLAIHLLKNSEKMTFTEYLKTNRFITDNKPSYDNKYAEFMNTPHWAKKGSISAYWWRPTSEEPETKQIRIDYLNKLIDNLK